MHLCRLILKSGWTTQMSSICLDRAIISFTASAMDRHRSPLQGMTTSGCILALPGPSSPGIMTTCAVIASWVAVRVRHPSEWPIVFLHPKMFTILTVNQWTLPRTHRSESEKAPPRVGQSVAMAQKRANWPCFKRKSPWKITALKLASPLSKQSKIQKFRSYGEMTCWKLTR